MKVSELVFICTYNIGVVGLHNSTVHFDAIQFLIRTYPKFYTCWKSEIKF
jgi:hypothetical protein